MSVSSLGYTNSINYALIEDIQVGDEYQNITLNGVVN